MNGFKIGNTVGKLLSKKALTVGGVISFGMNAANAMGTYKTDRAEGMGVIGAGAHAIGETVMWEAVGMKGMLGLGLLKHAPNALVKGTMALDKAARSMDNRSRNIPFANATFADSQQAYTMRQAGMQLAQNSRYNLEQGLMGNEASMMHRL